MRVYDQILNDFIGPNLNGDLHAFEHKREIDTIILNSEDLSRRRFKCETEQGHQIGISLPRTEKLYDGAILEFSRNYCLIVRVEPEKWLIIRPNNEKIALRLGYFAGNLHWTVKFDGELLLVALKQDKDTYLSRLKEGFKADEIQVIKAEKSKEEFTK